MSISNPRIEVKDAATAGWFGAREEARLPVHVSGAGRSAPPSASTESPGWKWDARVWLRRARRIVIDLAIVVAAMTAVPVLAVTVWDGEWWRTSMEVSFTRAKVHSAEASRPFGVPKDPSITPLEAGRSLAALQPFRQSKEFPMIAVPHPVATWQHHRMGPAMFPTARPNQINQAPDASKILEAVSRGFSVEELSYLRQLATAPVWREFDRVARAPAMDILGGEFVVPFTPGAAEMHMPVVAFVATKEMAYAAVSRAAYQLAIGRPDSAEAILRSIISYGFNISDNAAGLTPQLMGRVIVEIGRDALERFYVVTRDPRAASVLEARPPDASAMTPVPEHGTSGSARQSAEEMRQDLIARVMNPREMRGVRYSALELLSFSSCTNVRELLLGPRADVGRAFDFARHDLARYPSEQAFIDLIQRTPRSSAIYDLGTAGAVRRFLLGTSTIAGVVLHNPRLAACTWYTTEGSGF